MKPPFYGWRPPSKTPPASTRFSRPAYNVGMTRRNFIQSGAALTAAAQLGKGSPNGKTTVGMIGTGARAQELMQVILKLPEQAEIVGVVDAYKGRVERAISRTGGRAKAYADHHDLLEDKSIDAVVVA